MKIVFETQRLILREFTVEDAPLILQLNSDPAVTRYVHEPILKDEEAARKMITDIILPQYEHNLGRWAIHLKESNEFIGWCGLKLLPGKNEIDLGYRLIQTAWGKGFATEAAQHTLDHGFAKLHLPLIVGKAHTQNLASIKVLQKIGMVYKGEELGEGDFIKVFFAHSPLLKN